MWEEWEAWDYQREWAPWYKSNFLSSDHKHIWDKRVSSTEYYKGDRYNCCAYWLVNNKSKERYYDLLKDIIKNEKTLDETIEKLLTKEIATLNEAQLHELFIFYYKLNHQHANLISYDKFDDFLSSFDSNPFRPHKDKKFIFSDLKEKHNGIPSWWGGITIVLFALCIRFLF